MIEVCNVSITAGAFSLSDISFTVPTGAYAVLMGRTGGGKTTLLETICGLRPVRAGCVKLMSRDVTNMSPGERGIGYVPQDKALFSTMTIREHLAFALQIRRAPRQEIEKRVAEISDWLGIAHLLARRPIGLSGGEAQRVALGRALSFCPSVLLLDEPLSALDDQTREQMYDLLNHVRTQTRLTTLHVTHHQGEAKRLADQIIELK